MLLGNMLDNDENKSLVDPVPVLPSLTPPINRSKRPLGVDLRGAD